MDNLILYFFLVCFLYIFRIYVIKLHSFHFDDGISGDASGHYTIIKTFKEKITSIYVKQFLIKNEGPMSYAVFYHMIASLFSKKTIESRYKINLFFFCIFGLIYFLLVEHIISNNLIQYNSSSSFFIIICFFLFITSITNFYSFGTNIAYLDLGERFLAKILTSFYYFTLLIFFSSDNDYFILLSILFSSLSFLTSNFARQALIIPTLFFSFFTFSFVPILILFLGLILAIILQSKRFLRSLKFQYLHLKLYQKTFAKSELRKHVLSSFISKKDLVGFFKNKNLKNLYNVIFKEPIRGILFIPEIILLFITYFYTNDKLLNNSIPLFISIYLTYLIVSTKTFNFIGESYRYIEYTTYFLFPFLLSYIFVNDLLPNKEYFFIIYGVYVSIFFILYLKLLKFQKENFSTKYLSDLLENIHFSETNNILPIPLRLTLDICARTEANGIWWQPGNLTENIQNNYLEEYPFPSKDLFSIIKKHNITHVIVDINSLTKINWEYPFDKLILIYENETHRVYKV
ncbi:hypothetical protein CRV02_00640 [Arcobacter sp. CECT 8989]|uniref:hypothetical protein n=1 Tax=Arcobacter sp. CECT 8989 TaxID=2044509 RepID=UPI00100A9A3C|nr:hypothetical protein [Arcobacter sp. CECT 8989]RXK03733.1 hypothetical protein CRV02_00640 [Arcobacter sp. CECT 8989]